MTKGVFAKGISKIIPVIGGIFSATITLASMYPMGNRLIDALDEAAFVYDKDKLQADLKCIDATRSSQCEIDGASEPDKELPKKASLIKSKRQKNSWI